MTDCTIINDIKAIIWNKFSAINTGYTYGAVPAKYRSYGIIVISPYSTNHFIVHITCKLLRYTLQNLLIVGFR